MSDKPRLPIRGTLAGRWQIPLLVLAIGVLATSLARIASGYERVTPQQRLERIGRLRQAGALTRAHAYALYLLKDPDRPLPEQAELHRQLVGIIYQAEARFRRHAPQNVRSIITNFRQAAQLGATPDVNDWIALAEAYRWSDRKDDAIDAFRQVLRLLSASTKNQKTRPLMSPASIHRRLIELRAQPGQPLGPESLADIEAILSDGTASPAIYLWALEQKVPWLLAADHTDQALAQVDQARSRLAGTPQRLAMDYLKALCLRQAGHGEEAETLMRSFRNNWTAHDDLWGKSGWLLGKLQQDDDRPQAALSFYEDVLGAFQSGPIHDACRLGLAQSLVMLQRNQRALDIFRTLVDRVLARQSKAASPRFGDPPLPLPEARDGLRNRPLTSETNIDSPAIQRTTPRLTGMIGQALEPDVLRTTLTTAGESRFKAGERRLGIEYLQLALSLLPYSQRTLRSRYVARIAENLVALAEQQAEHPHTAGRLAQSQPASADRSSIPRTAQGLYQKAAEMYLLQSGIEPLDEASSARALEMSADNFDAAGQTDRVIEVLTKLVDQHPAYADRARALDRLGMAHQARQEYLAAIDAYARVLKQYPRSPDALAAMIPMAESLLKAGGPHVQQGVKMLIDIVDDRGPDPLFRPQADEYRRALFRLAEYYSSLDDDKAPGHLESAITRLEDAIALYPDDPQTVRLRFLLADAYRRSAAVIRRGKNPDAEAKAQADHRTKLALKNYSTVKQSLAPLDASELSDLEATYLRMSYLYIGDCLFDLGALDQAIEAYREVAWRYENQPAAVSATLQVVHCYERLGRPKQARAALARLEWLLKKIPDAAFQTQSGMTSKAYWQAMAKRVERMNLD